MVFLGTGQVLRLGGACCELRMKDPAGGVTRKGIRNFEVPPPKRVFLPSEHRCNGRKKRCKEASPWRGGEFGVNIHDSNIEKISPKMFR